MSYICGFDRNQVEMVYPDRWIADDSYVRVIDAFVDQYLLWNGVFSEKKERKMGRPSYSPSCMMKLYIYGVMNRIRSSRCLARECTRNLELKWLVQGVEPDFRIISDFRKDNIEGVSEACGLFSSFCASSLTTEEGKPLLGNGYYSIDGTKIRANQAKDKCFSASKIDDRIQNDNTRIQYYESILREMDENDKKEKDEAKPVSIRKERISKKIQEYKDRRERHEAGRSEIEKTGSQVALTDKDRRLMKNHYGGVGPSYNVQTAVDSETHLVVGFQTTNRCTDHGLVSSTIDTVDDQRPVKEVCADNGYRSGQDSFFRRCEGPEQRPDHSCRL